MPRKPTATPAPQQDQTQQQTTAPAQAMPPIHLDVRVRPVQSKGNLLGHVRVSINGAFAVGGIMLVTGKNGMFVSMPSYQDGTGKYHDICYPFTPEFRQQLNDAVVNEYQQTLERMQDISRQGPEQAQGQERKSPELGDPAMA